MSSSGVTAAKLALPLVALFGFAVGSVPVADNSLLTHLAAGRLVLDSGAVPTADPFSWASGGAEWTVQSWLPDVALAALERGVGLVGVRLAFGLLTALLAALVWRLTSRARSLAVRLVLVGLSLVVGAGYWVQRPLVVGLVCFAALVIVVGERWARPWAWAVAIFFVWLPSHGSWALGLVWLVGAAVGAAWWTDREGSRRTSAWSALAGAVGGLVLGALLWPSGRDLLRFPATLGERREAFAVINEWQPPVWSAPVTVVALVLVGLAFVGDRRTWDLLVAAAPLVVAAAISRRNIPVACLAVLPAAARSVPPIGTLRSSTVVVASGRILAGAWVVAVLLATGLVRQGDDFDRSAYPVALVTGLGEAGRLDGSARVVAPESVGNYLTWRIGAPPRVVWIDDRVDMYPIDVIEDHRTLLGGGPPALAVLDDRAAGFVVWPDGSALSSALAGSEVWEVEDAAAGWSMWCRRASTCSTDLDA